MDEKRKKTHKITFWVETELLEAFTRACKEERRTKSNMLRLLLMDYLERRSNKDK
ncbi:MAG: ribbon-helix-helix protein, CopG family [Candidatus Abawacabacteria bacterium]|nr:ribbon-helix-helix protein, CopG family [Candidatus Abawacabacteria bacterium]